MKKLFAFTLAALALLAVSCKKEAAPEAAPATITRTFTAGAPGSGTKTALSGEKAVVWSKGDKILVIAKTTGNTSTFTLKEGEGTASAKFEGEIAAADADETEFYAFYPASVALNLEDANYPLSDGDITVKSSLSQTIIPVKDGFDSSHALMTAVLDGSGNFSFRHGMAYFKIKIGYPGIQSIRFECSGSARFAGRPSYSIEDGSTTALQGTKSYVELFAEGTLEKGAVYYVPVTTRKMKVGTLKLTFIAENGEASVLTTESLAGIDNLESGLVYDLGCPIPSLGPAIDATDVTLDKSATSGAISYTILKPVDGGVVTAALKEPSDWLTVGSVSDGSVALSMSANQGSVRRATVVLTYTYNGSETTTAEVNVVQDGAAVEHYLWDFSSDEWQAEFAKLGAPNTDITNWNLTYDGLTIVSTQKSKYREEFFQWGGKGSVDDRYMTFTPVSGGTLSVYATYTGSSVPDPIRYVSVVDSTGGQQDLACNTPYGEGPERFDFTVAPGQVKIFCSVNALRFFKIEFTAD